MASHVAHSLEAHWAELADVEGLQLSMAMPMGICVCSEASEAFLAVWPRALEHFLTVVSYFLKGVDGGGTLRAGRDWCVGLVGFPLDFGWWVRRLDGAGRLGLGEHLVRVPIGRIAGRLAALERIAHAGCVDGQRLSLLGAVRQQRRPIVLPLRTALCAEQ